LDSSIYDGVKQSQFAYDSTILGVISTQPGVVLGNSDSPPGVQELVALAGRVPIHVTNENGDINAGDYLTSSDIPGVAMRATEPGRMVAVAMQSFTPDPSEGTTTGSILAFVNPGWSSGNLISTTSTASSTFSIDGMLQHFFGVVADVGNVIQTFIRASMVAVENLFVKTEVVLPGGSIKMPSGQDQMSGSATLAAFSSEVFIANKQVASSSKIFIAPTTLTNVPLVIVRKQDGVGFAVGAANPQAKDISFDWIMMQSYHVGGNDSSWNQNVAPAVSGGGSGNSVPMTIGDAADNGSSIDASSTDPVSASSSSDGSAGSAVDTATTTDITAVTTTTDTVNSSSDSAVTAPTGDANSTDVTDTAQ
jgi:hypothetical protein